MTLSSESDEIMRRLNSRALGYENPGTRGECSVIIGVDFGTSASKVIIRLPDLQGAPGFLVHFEGAAHKLLPYLLPTRLWFGGAQGDICSLEEQKAGRLVHDIKLDLLEGVEHLRSGRGPTLQTIDAREAAVAYLALLLRRAREWFLRTKFDLVRQFKTFTWDVNMGVPSPCIEDNKENRTFRLIGSAAWIVSMQQGVTLSEARRAIATVDAGHWERESEGCSFEIIPEIAAACVGYAQSPERRDGLFIVVDVGASTLDVCSVNLSGRDIGQDDAYALLTADVKKLGTIRLHQDRIDALRALADEKAQHLRDQHDPVSPMGGLDAYLLSGDEVATGFKRSEDKLRSECLRALSKVLVDLKTKRHPRAKEWNSQLPVFLIGGGMRVDFYRGLLDRFDERARTYVQNGIQLREMPLPPQLEPNHIKDEYFRFTVAWGLAHRKFDIGSITPADQIEDVPEREQYLHRDFISKDQV